MDKTRLSIDSLGESEIEKLRDALSQKELIIQEKSEIISSLKSHVNDLEEELEEAEKNHQLNQQKIDRLYKDIEEKDQLIEAVTHSRQEIETAHENLSSRYEARVGQVKELYDELKKTKKEHEKATSQIEKLEHMNQKLVADLELAKTRKRKWEEEQEDEQHQLRPQQHQRQQSVARPEIVPTLHFPMAEELGEHMNPSTALPRRCLNHQPKYIEESPKPKCAEQKYQPKYVEQNYQLKYVDQNYQPENNEQKYHLRYVEHKQRTEYVEKQPSPPPQMELDPIEEYKMRVARANELARRNKQTKPLLRTSYALEYDTFDLNQQNIEQSIQQPAVRTNHKGSSNQGQERKALVNRVNTTPVAKRVYKKAEAFIV